MRSSKSQDPSSKEAPSSKLQERGMAGTRNGESMGLRWWEETVDCEVLRENAPVYRAGVGQPNGDSGRPFDFQERSAQFGEAIVRFSKRIPRDPTNNRLIDQLVGAGTSVPANFCEASESVSKKDFRFSISRCLKEAKETRLFLRAVVASEPQLADEARGLWRETTELIRILSTMKNK